MCRMASVLALASRWACEHFWCQRPANATLQSLASVRRTSVKPASCPAISRSAAEVALRVCSCSSSAAWRADRSEASSPRNRARSDSLPVVAAWPGCHQALPTPKPQGEASYMKTWSDHGWVVSQVRHGNKSWTHRTSCRADGHSGWRFSREHCTKV